MKNIGTQQEEVENYLLNQLSEVEKAAFQTKLLFDKELQQEVKRVRQIQKTLVTENIRNNSTKNGFKFWKWILPILGLGLIGSYTYFSNKTTKSEDATSRLKKINDDIFVPIQEEISTPKIILPVEESTINSEKLEVDPTPSKKSPNQDPKKDKKLPIKPYIAANYDTNELLEAELATNFRGDYEFAIQSPTKEQNYISENGKINWSILGTLATEKIPIEDFDLQVEIYTNKKEEYENGNPQLSFPLKLEEAQTSNYSFSSNHQLDLIPSLYYYLIKDDLSGAILQAGKFTVRE